jgi:putative peptidoglycan lipid II flippase
VFVAIPATVGLILVARPLVTAVFGHGQFAKSDTNTEWTACTLSFYALGLSGYFWQQIATRAFYSTQDSKMPAFTAVAAVFVNVVLNLTLVWFMATAGLALSTAVCSYLQVVILVFVLRGRFGRSLLDGLLITVAKTIIATAFMWLAGWVVLTAMSGLPVSRWLDVLRLVIVVPFATIVYIAAAKLLRIEMLSLVTGGTEG